jgi:hypothetical protein
VRIIQYKQDGRRNLRPNTQPEKYVKDTTMSRKNNDQSYVESEEERERGHVDTREKNFECENKTSYGCDPGIDVAG